MVLRNETVVLFDAGFTLLEPAVPVPDAYMAAAAKLGIALPQQAFRARLARMWSSLNCDFRSSEEDLASSEALERDAWARFTRLLAEPYPDLARRHSDWLDLLFEHFDHPKAWNPIDGVFGVLERLRARGVAVGIVSNWHSSLRTILDGHELTSYFSFLVISSEVGRKKPHRQIFERALAESNAEPSQAVHIGDSWNDDVEGARRAGIRPVLFTKHRTEAVPDSTIDVINSLDQLAP